MNSLQERETWKVVDLPDDKNCTGCKWVFKLKTNSNGDPMRFKSKLVAQGFGQKKEITILVQIHPWKIFLQLNYFWLCQQH